MTSSKARHVSNGPETALESTRARTLPKTLTGAFASNTGQTTAIYGLFSRSAQAISDTGRALRELSSCRYGRSYASRDAYPRRDYESVNHSTTKAYDNPHRITHRHTIHTRRSLAKPILYNFSRFCRAYPYKFSQPRYRYIPIRTCTVETRFLSHPNVCLSLSGRTHGF